MGWLFHADLLLGDLLVAEDLPVPVSTQSETHDTGTTTNEISMSKPVVSFGNGIVVTDQHINRSQRFVATMHRSSFLSLLRWVVDLINPTNKL